MAGKKRKPRKRRRREGPTLEQWRAGIWRVVFRGMAPGVWASAEGARVRAAVAEVQMLERMWGASADE